MSFSAQLLTLLKADAALALLVSGRIYSDRAEQTSEKPFIVYALASTQKEVGLSGTVMARKDIFEVQCWGSSRAQVEAIVTEVERIFEADFRLITDVQSGYDPEVAAESTSLTVDWWD